MYLLGDIGNTEIKICIYNNNSKIFKKIVLKTNKVSNSYLKQNLKSLKKYKNKLNISLFCSVVPYAYRIIDLFFKNNFKTKIFEVKNITLNKIININVNKKQVGSDRLVNAISAIDNKSNYIIVDFGTATTFDVVIKKKYLGGIIAPGVNLSLSNLSSKASLIPKIKLSKTSNVIGKNTKNAVRSGFYWGYAGLIDNIIKLIIKQTGKSFKIIFTGGLSHLFKNSINFNVSVDKDLTIKGLKKIKKELIK